MPVFQSNAVRLTSVVRFLTVLVLFLFFFITFLQRHVYNNDFWWHLATGKYITEHGALPQDDPFSYTSHDTQSTRKNAVLKGYWLAQVVFYKIYSVWQESGIIFLRALLMLMFLFFIFLTVKKQGASDLLALGLVTCVFLFSRSSLGERPQLFTFLIFAVVMYLLEDFRITGSKKVFLVPASVLLLSNMHPGYIVCILLVSLYFAGAVVQAILDRTTDRHEAKIYFAVLCLTAICTLLNPNGPGIFAELLFSMKRIEGIVEFTSPLTLYINKMTPLDYSYIGFLLLSLPGLRYIRKIGPAHLLALVVFTAMSFIAVRYVIFYMCVAAVILARIILNIMDEKVLRGRLTFSGRKEGFLYLVVMVAGALFLLNSVTAMARYEFKADTSFSVPREAADFLGTLKLSGNMFNEYGFGGYLIWRLFPDKKVFIDGRLLEPDVYDEYKIVASAGRAGNTSYEDILRKYDITYVIMPPLLPGGAIYPLVERLLDRDDWALIYSDQLSMIFLKKDTQNRQVLEKFTLDKQRGLNTIILQASARAMKNPNNPNYLISLGKTFFRMSKIDDAKKAFGLASKIDPGNEVINEYLNKINESEGKNQN